MLPRALDGDRQLVHRWDEVNLVVAGSGMFTIGTDTIQVRAGSVVWVATGIGHWFHTLANELQILISWDGRASELLGARRNQR